jgi:hypothetical protein
MAQSAGAGESKPTAAQSADAGESKPTAAQSAGAGESAHSYAWGALLARGDRFTESFKLTFNSGFFLIIFYAIASLGLTIWSLYAGAELVSTDKGVFMVRLVQVSLGMIVGFFTIFLGVLVSWLGIESNYKLSGEYSGASTTLASASPGILLILCGTILLGICLTKPMGVTVKESDLPRILGLGGDTANTYEPKKTRPSQPPTLPKDANK